MYGNLSCEGNLFTKHPHLPSRTLTISCKGGYWGSGDGALLDLLRFALMPAPTFPKARKTGLSSSSWLEQKPPSAASEPGASSPVAWHLPSQCCLGLQGKDGSGTFQL